MDTKDIALLMLRAAGLLMFAYALFDIPYYFLPRPGSQGEYSFVASFMEAVAILVLPLALGLFLWFFPATVANRIVSGDRLTDGLKARDLERMAITIIGVWFIAYGFSDLVYRVGALVLMQRKFPDAPPLEPWLGIVAAVAKLVVGFALAVGADGLQRTIARVRSRD
jgi:hypothetical protein